MRCYTFSNMYLSSIQVGIQSAHSVAEMFMKYKFSSCHRVKELDEWAANHKTIICLNGGMNSNMMELLGLLNSIDNPYAWDYTVESEEAMASMLTNIAIILPEEIYNVDDETSKTLRNYGIPKWSSLTEFDLNLIVLKNKCRLAR